MAVRADAEALARTVPWVPFADGGWQPGFALETFEVIDPVTERPIAEVAEADPAAVDGAVRAAHTALDDGAWGRLDGASRGALLHKLADLLAARTEDFASLESLEIGKPGFEPRVIDLPQAVQTYRYFAGWADKITGATIPTPGYMGQPTLSYTIREPVGVVAAITPWNSPTMIASWKLAHTLARRVQAGAVAVNGWSPLDPRLPWGGSKLSGQGRELGWAGIEANTEERTVTVVL